MTSDEKPIFPTFVCDTGNSLKSYVKIETTLYSDHISFKGLTYDFERSIPLSKIDNVIYNDWREEVGLLFFKTAIPLASIMSIIIYSIFEKLLPSFFTLIMILIALHTIRLGELDIIINNESLPLVGNKGTMRRFWDQLESRLSILENNDHEYVGPVSNTQN